MKKILMLGTGGTIASEITESGLSPQLTTEQIMHYCPDISDFCSVDCLQLCNLDSTNIAPEHWQRMADSIRKEYNHYDGFVLTHGTDTMAYTAAALSYLIQYSKKPIVLTGSQKPINLEITDSKTNLVDAFHYAANEDAHGVSIVFNGRVILGTRARKTHSKSFQAFSSINYPELAVIQDGRLLNYITQECREKPVFSDKLDPSGVGSRFFGIYAKQKRWCYYRKLRCRRYPDCRCKELLRCDQQRCSGRENRSHDNSSPQ